MSDTKNLAQRLALASIDLRGWLPDKRNQEAKYDYISADAVLHRAGDALGKQGVVVLPSMTDHGYDIGTTASGKQRFDAWVRFEFVITDGETNLNATWFGRGTDYGAVDKAVYKAVTSGHKYFLMKLLNIGVGNEDSEHDEPQPQSKAQAQPAKKEKAANWYASAPSDKVKFVEFIAANVAHLSDPTVAMTAIKAVLDGANFTDKNKAELAQTVAQWQPPAPLSTDQLIPSHAPTANAFSTQ
jgi:hypothetical protein